MSFTSKDYQLAETFKDCLDLAVKIGLKTRGGSKEKKYFHVQFGDRLFFEWLLSIGLTPRKSLTIGRITIPDEFFLDFLRGSFDGDGSVYSYWDPRWHSSFMFYLTFISASRTHILWLHESILRLSGQSGRVFLSGSVYILRFAKSASVRMFQEMYYDDKLPKLERKFRKVQGILELNSAHNKDGRVLELVDWHG